jgi:hypothetical protein
MRFSNICERLLSLFVFSVKKEQQQEEEGAGAGAGAGQGQGQGTLHIEIVDEKFQIERDNIRQNADV